MHNNAHRRSQSRRAARNHFRRQWPILFNGRMSKKHERQNAVRQLIGGRQISSQEELKQLLLTKGWSVTQATLSRDLRDLGVVRAASGAGAKYLLPEMVVDDS